VLPGGHVIPTEADLVVVGGGAAGLAAAAAASERGLGSVVLLEKRGTLGGNAAMARGLLACESPVQKREMVDADRDVLFKTAMEWAHWKNINPGLVRAWINRSGETIQWLEDKGIDFVLWALYPNQMRLGHMPSEAAGRQLVSVLAKDCESRGVRLVTRTRAKRVLRAGSGEVSGVIAAQRDGQEMDIACRAVILATGGFAGNPELLKRYCPDYYQGIKVQGIPYSGDGLLMALEAGAACGERVPMLLEGPTPDCADKKLILKFSVTDPRGVWVNKLGRRFADESVGRMPFVSANAVAGQPDHVAFVLIDEWTRRELEKISLPVPDAMPTGNVERVLNELQAQAALGTVKIASTWPEIADWMGAAPEVLLRTIDGYNRDCASGYDQEFVKDRRYLCALREPPFYAVRTVCVVLDTTGGIKTSANLEVLDRHRDPIPGLYAAGVLVDGFEPETYCAELVAGAFGFAVNSGRMAGESAANICLPGPGAR
jgi:fumarate reductase flavoprotein subunit